MKKLLHISCISCFIISSHISAADTAAPQSDPTAPLILIDDEGSTRIPKKKLQKLNATQPTNNAAPAQPATSTVPAQPTAPAVPAQPSAPTVAVQPTAPATMAVQPTAPATVAVQPAAPATVAVQPAAPATMAVQPTSPATVAVQPAAPATVAVQPAAPATMAAQPTAPATVAVQPTAPATVAVQPTAPVTVQPVAPTVVAEIPKPSGPIDCLYQLPQTPVSENELSLWAQYAALKSFEYSFDKLDDQLQKLKYCYTDQGWTGFHDALQQSGNLSVIKNQQLTVSSQISGDPVINKIKENQWSISLPLSVVYQNTQEKFTQSLSVTLVVTKKTPNELGIVQLIATVKPEKV